METQSSKKSVILSDRVTGVRFPTPLPIKNFIGILLPRGLSTSLWSLSLIGKTVSLGKDTAIGSNPIETNDNGLVRYTYSQKRRDVGQSLKVTNGKMVGSGTSTAFPTSFLLYRSSSIAERVPYKRVKMERNHPVIPKEVLIDQTIQDFFKFAHIA